MLGTVWASLKCTTVMDRLKKITMKNPNLQNYYKREKNIGIGFLGMINDTLSISECGFDTIEKSVVTNSFIETEKLTISKEKSKVVHIGNNNKCKTKCPKVKVHM